MASRAHLRINIVARAGARMLAAALPGMQRAMPPAPKRILIAHHLLLGDAIMLTPLIAKCRARWPDAEIVLTCPLPFIELYARQPYGVRAVAWDPRVPSTLPPLLARKGFDLALVPGDNRLSWLARALDARWIVAFAGDSPRYKDWPVDELRPYPSQPMAWGDLVARLVDGPPPPRYSVADWPLPAAEPVAVPATRYCVLHAGASTPLKQWPAERWRGLAQRLEAEGCAVVLSAGPGETALVDAIDPESRWMRHAGTLTLVRLAHLIAGASLLVCPDTGVAHLARLVGTPTVALFGPGSALLSGAGEFWRTSPFTALTIADFPCRDQSITMKREVAWIRRCERFPGTGPGQCPQPRCMLALGDEMAWRAAAARLGIDAD